MTSSFPWTDDRVAVLKRLWQVGETAAAIARALGGVSRNAVIGKVYRLGLVRRGKPAQPGSRHARPAPPERRLPRRPRLGIAPPPSTAHPEPMCGISAAALPASGLADMRTVGRHACRWPIGDPLAAGFSVCGRPAVRGAYCAAHGALAYRPTPRDHLLKLAGLR